MRNIFDKYPKKYDSWYERNKFAYLSELGAVKKAMPQGPVKGLEIGAGTGRFTSALGIQYAVDPSKNMLKILKQKGVKAILAKAENLPFADSRFDYAAIIISLCFIGDPYKVISEARRALKKGGKIIIGIIDKKSFLGKFYSKKKSLFYKEANFFSVQEITDLLKENGFNKISYYQTIFKPLDKIKIAHPAKKGFGKGGFVVISGYKTGRLPGGIWRKFRQYERISLLFKHYGYNMDEARQKVLKRAGAIFEPILDVGTGPGRMAYTLAQKGFELTSIDISKEAQDVARIYARRKKVYGRIRFIKMDAQNMKFKDKAFSTVISANLLHDLGNPRQAVGEMIRAAKEGGKIIISDLNKKGKALVNKVYRINKEIKRGKPVNPDKVVAEAFYASKIRFKKYEDGYISTFVGKK